MTVKMVDQSKDFKDLWEARLLNCSKLNLEDKTDSFRFLSSQLNFVQKINSDFQECGLEKEVLDCHKEYANLMDDKSKMNNYAEAILYLNKASKNESKNWMCDLQAEDLLDCVPVSPTKEDLNEEFKKLTNCFNFKKPRTLPKLSQENNDLKTSSFKTSNEKETNFNEQNSFFKSNSNFTSSSNPKCEFSKFDDEIDITKIDSRHNWLGKSHGTTVKTLQHKKSQERLSFPNAFQPSNNTENQKSESLKYGAFRTASYHLATNDRERAASSRSLGLRRGVKSRFVPPQKRDEEMSDRQSAEDYEIGGLSAGDPRLRNVDPKMVSVIMNEIVENPAAVAWDDVAGLQHAKAVIQEIVVWPLLRPDLFTGLRGPPKGLLLFGPPGTGKTMIGKCIASQSGSTFFSISASSLTSKWIGEGEKMVRALFAVARCHEPAVIFIDEIDSLLTQRGDSEHEASRRIKTEFLVQLDGATTSASDRVLIVGATNRPQDLDEAARRRLVKRIYIPLPDQQARSQMVSGLLRAQPHSLTSSDIAHVGASTDGFSGADVASVCRDAALGPIRDEKDIRNVRVEQVRPISVGDFEAALRVVRPSVCREDLATYEQWDAKYGINIKR